MESSCSSVTSIGSCPFKIILSCSNLKMALGNAKIHLSESNQREVPLGLHPCWFSIPCRDILEEEFLLINSCWGKKSSFHTLPEPAWRMVIGIADLHHALDLVRNAFVSFRISCMCRWPFSFSSLIFSSSTSTTSAASGSPLYTLTL